MKYPDSTEYQPIASFIPGKVDFDALEKFLSEHGITCVMAGSRAYQVRVPGSKADEAATLLKESRFKDDLYFY